MKPNRPFPADAGHDAGLAGQITCRADQPDTLLTQQLGLGFDEIAGSNLIHVNHDLETLSGRGIPNPANRFHTWIYRQRPDVNCIIHTHPAHVAALSMIGEPLAIAQMDTTPLYGDCAYLEKWPGVPVGNEEGEIIAAALGDKRAILLAHHGQLVVGRTIEEACLLAILSNGPRGCSCWPWPPARSGRCRPCGRWKRRDARSCRLSCTRSHRGSRVAAACHHPRRAGS